mmetsp:Transcript_28264/g.76330  ORF Transcript_28264/g.76330 Transcript_28264/m.76330 type:complete len:228 (+) Transcript_28264:2399-3082(+)
MVERNACQQVRAAALVLLRRKGGEHKIVVGGASAGDTRLLLLQLWLLLLLLLLDRDEGRGEAGHRGVGQVCPVALEVGFQVLIKGRSQAPCGAVGVEVCIHGLPQGLACALHPGLAQELDHVQAPSCCGTPFTAISPTTGLVLHQGEPAAHHGVAVAHAVRKQLGDEAVACGLKAVEGGKRVAQDGGEVAANGVDVLLVHLCNQPVLRIHVQLLLLVWFATSAGRAP